MRIVGERIELGMCLSALIHSLKSRGCVTSIILSVEAMNHDPFYCMD